MKRTQLNQKTLRVSKTLRVLASAPFTRTEKHGIIVKERRLATCVGVSRLTSITNGVTLFLALFPQRETLALRGL